MCFSSTANKPRVFTSNLKGKVPQQAQMERELKAIIQQYMMRMTQNKLL